MHLLSLAGASELIIFAAGAHDRSSGWQRSILHGLPTRELRDVECDHVRGSLVNWPRVRAEVQRFDALWRDPAPPDALCTELSLDAGQWEYSIVIAREADAASECTLGALAAALVLVVCEYAGRGISAEGNATAAAFTHLWRRTLEGDQAVPAYMLGTSSWPIASLLSKLLAHAEAAANPRDEEMPHEACSLPEVVAFAAAVRAGVHQELVPLILRPSEARSPDMVLGLFAHTVTSALTNLMNGPAAASPSFTEDCPVIVATQSALLVLFRLLGPPVTRDPLHGARLEEFGALIAALQPYPTGRISRGLDQDAGLSMPAILPCAVVAILAVSWHLTWRSHHLYAAGIDVSMADIRRTLESGASLLETASDFPPERPGRFGNGVLQSLHDSACLREHLWRKVAGGSDWKPIWRMIARWLLDSESDDAGCLDANSAATPGEARSSTTSPVYMSMGFGQVEEHWLRSFAARAMVVGLKRFVFVTPDANLLIGCDQARREFGAGSRMLCLRILTPSVRPYDPNNKAKFFAMPIFLSLGVDVIWLDLDIFLFQDPTARLLTIAYEESTWPRDILVTDHFDEHCLNHGVFLLRSSDRALLWLLEYTRWMHWYPYGHDQNGWDAFLAHSIVEPQLPKDLRTNPLINVSYAVLNTETEFVTLTGWVGSSQTRRSALLLHFTCTQGISGRSKKARLLSLFNATGKRVGDANADARRDQMAAWRVLQPLRTSWPKWKRPCYEGIHIAMGQLLETGLYEELLA